MFLLITVLLQTCVLINWQASVYILVNTPTFSITVPFLWTLSLRILKFLCYFLHFQTLDSTAYSTSYSFCYVNWCILYVQVGHVAFWTYIWNKQISIMLNRVLVERTWCSVSLTSYTYLHHVWVVWRACLTCNWLIACL